MFALQFESIWILSLRCRLRRIPSWLYKLLEGTVEAGKESQQATSECNPAGEMSSHLEDDRRSCRILQAALDSSRASAIDPAVAGGAVEPSNTIFLN